MSETTNIARSDQERPLHDWVYEMIAEIVNAVRARTVDPTEVGSAVGTVAAMIGVKR